MGRMYDLLARTATNRPAPAEDSEPEGEAPFFEVGAGAAEEPAEEPAPREVRTLKFDRARPPAEAKVYAITFRPYGPLTVARRTGEVGPGLIAFHDPEHPVSGQYRRLAADLADQAAGGEGPPVLAFTGADRPRRTAVVLNLAATLAGSGLKVGVIEGGPGSALGGDFGLAVRSGWIDALGEGREPARAAVPTPVPGVTLLPAGTPGPAVLSPSRVIAPLRGRFDWLLIDCDLEPVRQCFLRAESLAGLYLVAGDYDADDPRTGDLMAELEGLSLPVGGLVVAHD